MDFPELTQWWFRERGSFEITLHDRHSNFIIWKQFGSHRTFVMENTFISSGENGLLFGWRPAGRKTRFATRTKDSHFSAETIRAILVKLTFWHRFWEKQSVPMWKLT